VKRFLVVAAVGALAALTAALGGSTAYGGSSASTAAAPIKIGALTSLTGNFAPWGIQARSGMALAVNEINRSGGVKGRGGGRRLSLVVADDQSSNTNAAIDGFRRLTQQENVVAVGGTIGSNIGLPVSRLAEDAKVPYFLVKSGNNEILTQSSRYTFRSCLPSAAMVAVSVVQLAQRHVATHRRRCEDQAVDARDLAPPDARQRHRRAHALADQVQRQARMAFAQQEHGLGQVLDQLGGARPSAARPGLAEAA